MADLSLCMIVRNEADYLGDCLASVHGLVDEIVVVDTGSTDDTPAIAERAGARVIHEPWIDDFAHARNTALANATGEWVLILDADERIAAGHEALRSFVERDDVDCGLLTLHNAVNSDANLDDVVTGPGRSGEPILLPRLVRRMDDLEWRGCVHEDIDHWLADRVDRMSPLELHVVHFGAHSDVRKARGKSERNIHLLRKRLDTEPENVGLWVHLGNELNSIGETEEARAASDQAWFLITKRVWIGVPPHMVQAFTLRARMQWDANELTDLGATVEYTRAVMQSANPGPLHPNVYFLDGIASENLALYAHTRRQRWELLARAAGSYETLSRLANGRWTAFVIPEILGSRGRIRFAGVLVQLGQFEHALSVLTPEDTDGPAGQLVQGEALLGLGRTTEARSVLSRVNDALADPDRPALLAHAALHEGNLEEASHWVELAASGLDAEWMSGHRAPLLSRARAALNDHPGLVFLGGAPHSGMELLAAALDAHPAICLSPAMELMPRVMSALDGAVLPSGGAGAIAGARPNAIDRATRAFVEQLAEEFRPEGELLIDCAHMNVMHMTALCSALPGARFVYVVRDGRDVAAALLRGTSGPVDELPPHRRSPTAAANYWAEITQCTRQDHAPLLGLVLEVRFEELMAEPEATLRKVLGFVGRPWEHAALSALEAASSTHERGARLYADAVEAEVGYLLRDLGYTA